MRDAVRAKECRAAPSCTAKITRWTHPDPRFVSPTAMPDQKVAYAAKDACVIHL